MAKNTICLWYDTEAEGAAAFTLRPFPTARWAPCTTRPATIPVEKRATCWLRSDWRGLAPGVLVRRDDPGGQGQTLLLDATPSAGAPSSADWDEPIPVGAAMTAAGGRLVVRVEAETNTTADVAVEIDGARAASGPATPDRTRAPLRMPAR